MRVRSRQKTLRTLQELEALGLTGPTFECESGRKRLVLHRRNKTQRHKGVRLTAVPLVPTPSSPSSWGSAGRGRCTWPKGIMSILDPARPEKCRTK